MRRDADGSDRPEGRRVAGTAAAGSRAGAAGRRTVFVVVRPEPRRSASHAGDRADRRRPGAVGRRGHPPDTVGHGGHPGAVGRRSRPETAAAHRCGAAAYRGRRVRGRLVFAPLVFGDATVLRRRADTAAAAAAAAADRPATAPTTAAGPGAAAATAPAPAAAAAPVPATTPAAPATASAGHVRRQSPVARL